MVIVKYRMPRWISMNGLVIEILKRCDLATTVLETSVLRSIQTCFSIIRELYFNKLV